MLNEPKGESGGLLPTAAQALTALALLKQPLAARGEASDLFARERGDGLDALLGHLAQSVFGEAAHPSIERGSPFIVFCGEEPPVCRWQ